MLRTIHQSRPLALATSKPEFPASIILDHGNLTANFRVISGSSIDEIRSAKKDVIAEALTRFRMIGVDTSRPVMVGDRDYDVEGAAANGMPAIFVTWGYGKPGGQGSIAQVGHPRERFRCCWAEPRPVSAGSASGWSDGPGCARRCAPPSACAERALRAGRRQRLLVVGAERRRPRCRAGGRRSDDPTHGTFTSLTNG